MATRDQLIQGLQAADAAGNTADAQSFASAIKAMDAQTPPAPQDQGSVVMRRPGTPAPAPAGGVQIDGGNVTSQGGKPVATRTSAQAAQQPAAAPAQPAAQDDPSLWDTVKGAVTNFIPSTVNAVTGLGKAAVGIGKAAVADTAKGALAIGDYVTDPNYRQLTNDAVVDAVSHPVRTYLNGANDLANYAGGVGLHLLPKSMVDAALQTASNPQAIQAALDASKGSLPAGVIDHMKGYLDPATFKQRLRDDPAGVLLDFGTLAAGGEGAIAKGLDVAENAGVSRYVTGAAREGVDALAQANPISVAAKVAKAPAAAVKAVGGQVAKVAPGVGAAIQKVAPVLDPVSALSKFGNTTVGGLVSMLSGAAGSDKAAKLLRDNIPPEQLHEVMTALSNADSNTTAREALAGADLQLPVIQAIGEAIEQGPGRLEAKPIADAKAAARQQADDALVQSQQDAQTGAKTANLQSLDDLAAQHTQQARDLADKHTLERASTRIDSTDQLRALQDRHAAEVQDLTSRHENETSDLRAQHQEATETWMQNRQGLIDQLTSEADAKRAALAGGADATEALAGVDKAREAVNAKTGPIRRESLAAANSTTSDMNDLASATVAARETAAARTADAKRLLSARDRLEAKAAGLGDDVTMEDLQRVRGQAGGLDRIGGEAAARGVDAGEAARAGEAKLQELAARGLKPLDVDAIADQVTAMARAPGTLGNRTKRLALEATAGRLKQLVKDSGGVVDARDLYEFRKSGLSEVIDQLHAQTGSKSATAGLLNDVKPIVDKAIEDAGGDRWREYLREHRAGMVGVDQRQLAVNASRMSDKDIAKLARGDKPEAVENVFGAGNRDIRTQMTEAVGEGGQNYLAPIKDIADTLGRRDALKDSTKASLKEIASRQAAELADKASSQEAAKAVQEARHQREQRAFDDAKASNRDEQQSVHTDNQRQLKDAQDEQKAAMARRHNQAMDDMVARHAQELADHRAVASRVPDAMKAQADTGSYAARKALNSKGGNAVGRFARDIGYVLGHMKGVAVVDFAKVVAETKISRGMQKALVDAYKSPERMSNLLNRLKPSQRADLRGRLERIATAKRLQAANVVSGANDDTPQRSNALAR